MKGEIENRKNAAMTPEEISIEGSKESKELTEMLAGLKIGVAVCGSFCTFKKVFETTERLKALGAEIIPIMSFNAASISSRFGKAEENLALLESIAGRKAIVTIEDAEPIGPKKITDVMLLPNCTGNTMAKLAMSITDTAVVYLRKQCPIELAPIFPLFEGVLSSCFC